MMLRNSAWLGLAPALMLSLVGPGFGQEEGLEDGAVPKGRSDVEEPMELVDLRITAHGVGQEVTVDRGSRDGVQVRDRVQLRPRDGRVLWALVVRVEERSAVLEIRTPGPLPPVGTRGSVRLPSSRFAAPEPKASPFVVPKAAPEEPEEENPWEFVEEGWTPDMPLLAGVGVLRPEARPMTYAGRAYLIGDWIRWSGEPRKDSFLRAGSSVSFDNPFDYGGVVQYEGEHNWRNVTLPEEENQNEDFSDFRLDRLSYAWGGTRFEPHRVEVGRFLHHNMPEFGVVEGVEWSERRESGGQIGASLGFLPEPRANGRSRQDVGLSVWYGWSPDETETTAVRGGYQKTFNDGNVDRDLFVLKAHHLPASGWNLQGTAWLDRYDGDDNNKNSSFELTQAFLSAGHRWESGDGIDLTYTQARFPEILRQEFIPVTPDALANHYDERLGVSSWKAMGGGKRLRSRAGLWRDQDEEGFDVDLALDVPDLLLSRSLSRFTVFANDAKYSKVLGLRLGYGRSAGSGRWDAYYEWSSHHRVGFQDDVDDSVQQRLHGSRSFFLGPDLNVSLYGTLLFQDIENAYQTGIYLQWSF